MDKYKIINLMWLCSGIACIVIFLLSRPKCGDIETASHEPVKLYGKALEEVQYQPIRLKSDTLSMTFIVRDSMKILLSKKINGIWVSTGMLVVREDLK